MHIRLKNHRQLIQNQAKSLKDLARGWVKGVTKYEDDAIAIPAPEEARLCKEREDYELNEERKDREAKELKARITANRFIQMQELKAIPLDYDLCQTATEATWEIYVSQWTKQKADRDAVAAAAKAKADAEAEVVRLAEIAREAAEKAEADAKKAAEDEKRAEEAEERRLAAVALAAERAENARLKAETEKLKLEKAALLLVKALSSSVEILDLHDNTFTRKQSAYVAECAEKNAIDDEAIDLNKLNDWRMEIKKAIESVPSPVFYREETQAAFELERADILAYIPEIYPL